MSSKPEIGPPFAMGDDSIVRLNKPSREVFEREHLLKHKPCIITGMNDDWPALRLWDHDYLRRTIGKNEVPVSTTEGKRSVFTDDVKRYVRMSFAEFLDLDHSPENPKRYLTIQRAMEKAFPELMNDISLPPLFPKQHLFQANFWYVPGINMTPAHFDMAANLLCMIKGRKRLLLGPPGAPFYPHPVIGNFAQVDLEAPDLARFPKFTREGTLDVVIQPGEMLFIPGPWWHQVYSEPSIAVNIWWWPRGLALLKTFVSPQVFSHCLKRVRQQLARKLTGRRGPTSVYDS